MISKTIKVLAILSITLPSAAIHGNHLSFAGIIPQDRRIDWSHAVVSGGVPNRTAICATINAATYGNGTTDAPNAIQTALNH